MNNSYSCTSDFIRLRNGIIMNWIQFCNRELSNLLVDNISFLLPVLFLSFFTKRSAKEVKVFKTVGRFTQNVSCRIVYTIWYTFSLFEIAKSMMNPILIIFCNFVTFVYWLAEGYVSVPNHFINFSALSSQFTACVPHFSRFK